MTAGETGGSPTTLPVSTSASVAEKIASSWAKKFTAHTLPSPSAVSTFTLNCWSASSV